MHQIVRSLYLWIDSQGIIAKENSDKIDILRCLPFIATHLLCLGVFFVEFSWSCLILLAMTYSLRVFALTAFYHRYFSHRALSWWAIASSKNPNKLKTRIMHNCLSLHLIISMITIEIIKPKMAPSKLCVETQIYQPR